MTFNASVKLLTASLVFSAVVLTSFMGNAQRPTPTANWVNIRDPQFGAMGNGSHDDTAAIQAAIDYALAHELTAVYCPTGNYKISRTIYLDPPGNLRSNLSKPTMFGFSMAFFGDPGASTGNGGCRIWPNFNNSPALLVGPGQGMRVSDISVTGPATNQRGLQPSAGVGIGLTGGNGGSSNNLVENTYVANFYTLYKTNANDACCLNDSNTFRKVSGDNGAICIQFGGGQNDINDIVEPRLACTVGIDNPWARQVSVWGGNISGGLGTSTANAFGISGTSALSGSPGNPYTFTTTVAAPDAFVGSSYDSYMVATAHFGVVPLYMSSWNSSTHVATLGLWFDYTNGTINLASGTDLSAEIQAATTLYASVRNVVARGIGISLTGIHIENPQSCTSVLYYPTELGGGSKQTEMINPYFGYDVGLSDLAPANGPSPAGLAQYYCQQVFPFIGFETGNYNRFILRGGNYGQSFMPATASPVLIETPAYPSLSGSELRDLSSFNIRVGADYQSYRQIGGDYQFETTGRGVGVWDTSYSLPSAMRAGTRALTMIRNGELTVPYCGYEPCSWTTPNLSPGIYSLVSGSLGALGTYPPIACRTVFKSVDWNSPSLAHAFLRSASCPGYSWGQNLTNSTVGETVTWSYKGQSDTLYLNPKTLGWMFPGLGISLDNGSGAVPYIVTRVHPQLGYVTVINATSNIGGPLVGNKTTVYACSSGCSILQAPFSWTAY